RDQRLTLEQYERIKLIPFFQRAVESAAIEWNSPLNTKERLRLEAAATLETVLPILGARASNPREDLNRAVEAGKLFAKIAGVDSSPVVAGGPSAVAAQFVIKIDLGADEKLIKDVTPRTGTSEIRENAERNGDRTA